MNTIEYFRGAMKEAHTTLTAAVKDLTDSQIHFRPLGTGNSIAFIFWHYVRTEDIMINFFLQGKKPIWNTEGWDRKFGMDPKSQGTGMTAEQAAAIRLNDMGEFLKYSEKVFQTSEAFLGSLPEESLDEIKEYPVIGKRSVRQVLAGMVLQHGAGHLGEIWYVKGLQGLKGSPV
ncbi:MAG: DinB family protein [Deltaproteobacteria bacterium]|nr:DinB family protein [Deltaproteobacteria bacterium]